MEDFLAWWNDTHTTDLRSLSNQEVEEAIALWKKLPGIGEQVVPE